MSDIGAILETGGAAAVELAASALMERGGKVGTCANCNEPLIGPYCAVCGQPRNVHRRAVHHLIADLISDLVSFDSRILRTARALLLRPGELALAYREGRTQPYVPAVRLYLFVSLIFFLVLSAAHIALFQFSLNVQSEIWGKDQAGHIFLEKDGRRTPMPGFRARADGQVMVAGRPVGTTKIGDTSFTVTAPPQFFKETGHFPPVSPAVKVAMQKMQHDALDGKGDDMSARIQRAVSLTLNKLAQDPAALNAPMTEWLPRLLFLLMPLFALLMSLFYWRRRKSIFFVDHLVFSLNYHSFGFALLLLALLPAQFIGQGVLLAFLFGAMSLYLLLAMKRVYGQGWLMTALKFAGFGLIYSLFILGPAFAGLLTVSVINA